MPPGRLTVGAGARLRAGSRLAGRWRGQSKSDETHACENRMEAIHGFVVYRRVRPGWGGVPEPNATPFRKNESGSNVTAYGSIAYQDDSGLLAGAPGRESNRGCRTGTGREQPLRRLFPAAFDDDVVLRRVGRRERERTFGAQHLALPGPRVVLHELDEVAARHLDVSKFELALRIELLGRSNLTARRIAELDGVPVKRLLRFVGRLARDAA